MVLNPNEKVVAAIKKGLEKTGGYCPCRIERTEDNICQCKEFREDGICICKLYVPVEVFSADWCGHCTKLKTELDAKGISYSIRDISDNANKDEIMDKGFRTVPILKIGDKYFNPVEDKSYRNYLERV